jgi:hypothetical protein
MTDIDRVVHEPVRLRILMILSGVDLADFKFLVSTLQLKPPFYPDGRVSS